MYTYIYIYIERERYIYIYMNRAAREGVGDRFAQRAIRAAGNGRP